MDFRVEFFKQNFLLAHPRIEEIAEVKALRASIYNLCSKVSPLSSDQVIPENVLISHCKQPQKLKTSFLEVLPVDNCNHRCEWCFTLSTRYNEILPTHLLKEQLDQFIAQGGNSVLFSGGGEPLLYNPFLEPTREFDDLTVVEWLSRQNVTVGLITNGVYLDRFIMANLKCLSSMAFIRVSLDAYSPESYKQLHKAKDNEFDRVCLSLKNIIKQRGALLAPGVGISFVVDSKTNLNSNHSDLLGINRLGRNVGIDFIQLKHLHTKGQEKANVLMQQIQSWCEELKSEGGMQWWIHRYFNSSSEEYECQVPLVGQLIGSNGSRSPCCHLQGKNLPELDLNVGLSPFKVYGCKSEACRHVSMSQFLKSIQNDHVE